MGVFGLLHASIDWYVYIIIQNEAYFFIRSTGRLMDGQICGKSSVIGKWDRILNICLCRLKNISRRL